ncbi:MAG TPA: PaaI family thioesterase [Acidimicrobiales bacterium]|nr:PaaI family thioesterase [Acidimicrobiales bacterium]
MTTTETVDRTPSGLELLRSWQERGPSSVGVMRLLGARMQTAEHGRVVFAAETCPDFGNPMGTLHGGIAATMLDSAMGCAVLSALGPGVGYTTIDLAVKYLRPVPLDGTTLWADGRTVHVGGRMATATGRLTDRAGRLIATATTTCLVFEEAA